MRVITQLISGNKLVQRAISGMSEGQSKKSAGGSGGSQPPPAAGSSGTNKEPQADPRMMKRTTYLGAMQRIGVTVRAATFQQASLIRVTNLRETFLLKVGNFEQAHMEYINNTRLTPAQYEVQNEIYAAAGELTEEVQLAMDERIAILTPPPAAMPAAPAAVRVEVKASDLQPNSSAWGKFDGNMLHWQSFRDRFKAAVHENAEMKSVFKLQQLLNAVTGKAAAVVGTRQSTDAGYEGAWTRLCEVFDDDYLIVSAVLAALFALKKLERATDDGLRRLVDTTHEATRQLRTLGLPVEHWDAMLVYILVERLDEVTKSAWEMHREQGIPTLVDVCTFLDRRARSSAHAHPDPDSRWSAKRRANSEQTRSTGSVDGAARRGAIASSSGSGGNSGPPRRALPPCRCCKGDHPLYHCPEFKNLNLAGRKQAVHDWKLCLNCLREGHEASKCNYGPCVRCPNGRKHNSIICPTREANVKTATLTEQAGPAKKRFKWARPQNVKSE